MSLRIGAANLASLTARRYLTESSRKVGQQMRALASGNRFTGAQDPAGLAISEHLKGQAQGLRISKLNAENAISFVQVAEGGLNEQNNILIRLRELAVQAASDTFTNTERGFLDVEYQGLLEEVDRIAQTTRYGSTELLTGAGTEYAFQVGPYGGEENQVRFSLNADTRISSLDIDGTHVGDASDARSALSYIDSALTKIGSARASFGAAQSRLQSAQSNLEIQHENITAAYSQLADTDIAEAASEMTRNLILQNMQVSVLSQSRLLPEAVLPLLG